MKEILFRYLHCDRKIKYTSEERAQNYANILWKKNIIVTPYRCKFCNGWHNGHHKKELKNIDIKINNLLKYSKLDSTSNSFLRMRNFLNKLFKRNNLKELPKIYIDINNDLKIIWNKSFYLCVYIPKQANQKIKCIYGKTKETKETFGYMNDRQLIEIITNKLNQLN